MKYKNLRILFYLIAVVIIMALVLPACAPAPTPAPAPAPAPAPTPAPLPAPAPAPAKAEPVSIRISADVPAAPHPKGQAMAEFKEIVEERIPGSEVKVYYSGMLFTDPDACEALIAGNQEICWAQGGKISGIEKRLGATEFPSMYSSKQDLADVDNSQLVAYLSDLLKAKGILWMGTGSTNPFTGIASIERIKEVADWEGKIIRTTSAASIFQFELTGASSLVMPFSEVASALATGVIDGCYTSTTAWRNIADVAPYFTSIGIGGLGISLYPFLVSEKWWDTLTPETQKVLADIFREINEREKDLAFSSSEVVTKEFVVDDPSKEGYWDAPPELQEVYKELWVPACYDYHRADFGDKAIDLAVLFAQERK